MYKTHYRIHNADVEVEYEIELDDIPVGYDYGTESILYDEVPSVYIENIQYKGKDIYDFLKEKVKEDIERTILKEDDR